MRNEKLGRFGFCGHHALAAKQALSAHRLGKVIVLTRFIQPGRSEKTGAEHQAA